jgi:hypothetical protein
MQITQSLQETTLMAAKAMMDVVNSAFLMMLVLLG